LELALSHKNNESFKVPGICPELGSYIHNLSISYP